MVQYLSQQIISCNILEGNILSSTYGLYLTVGPGLYVTPEGRITTAHPGTKNSVWGSGRRGIVIKVNHLNNKYVQRGTTPGETCKYWFILGFPDTNRHRLHLNGLSAFFLTQQMGDRTLCARRAPILEEQLERFWPSRVT